MLSLIALVPILILLILGAIDLWVYADAKAHSRRGTPVIFSSGFLTVDTPAAWFFRLSSPEYRVHPALPHDPGPRRLV
jgi:hypothetical protein